MFFKFLKNKLLLLVLLLIIIPTNVLAYSEYIIAGGENIGIELTSSNVIIVGTYSVDNINPASNANLKIGDKIVSINNTIIGSIKELIDAINGANDKSNIEVTYYRGSNLKSTTLKLIKDTNNVFKTGLYVKDSISGVGTLTFIDPNTNIFGALGHEIIEKSTGQKIEIKDGKIYNSIVTGVTPSVDGAPGEKNARYDTTKIYGNVNENTTSGVFGDYTATIPNKKLYKVATIDDIKIGDAKILTVLKDEKVEEFSIKILKVSNSNDRKNLLFEITDKRLLDETGGIIQGMSGSPIIQGDYIIGAVTHVVVNEPTKGYGILITKMLEESEN